MTKIDKKLGENIKILRKQHGITQQKLADLLGLSRPTVSQIEIGERKLSADELIKLADIFNISVEYLLGLKREPKIIIKKTERKEKPKYQVRINVPQKNIKKFKEVLLYILNKVGSKPNIGETVLYKILYFIDFDFYEKYEEQLIGATYESTYFEYPQTKYLPVRKADLTKFKANEIELIDNILYRLSGMNASQISEYSHNDVPWLTTENQGIIEYESVFYRTPSYSVREYDEDIQ
jgi:transcriptional regulator with XRE-family HTH domain